MREKYAARTWQQSCYSPTTVTQMRISMVIGGSCGFAGSAAFSPAEGEAGLVSLLNGCRTAIPASALLSWLGLTLGEPKKNPGAGSGRYRDTAVRLNSREGIQI